MTSRKKTERSPRTTKARKVDAKRGAASSRKPLALVARATIDVEPLFDRIVAILEEARSQVVRTVNSAMLLAYWHIGREIVEFVQRGAARAAYGEQVIETLADRLRVRVGRGYSARNLRYFRSFYLAYADREPSIRDAGGEFGTSLVPKSSRCRRAGRAAGTEVRSRRTCPNSAQASCRIQARSGG